MDGRIKNVVLTAVSLLAIAAVIFWQFSDRQKKEMLLSDSLDLLGQKLLSLVHDESAKQDLQLMFNDFRDKAVEGLLGPKDVEQVAASILNMENAGDTLSQAQAASILPVLFHENIRKKRTLPSGPEEKKWRPGEKRELGQRLHTVLEFNERMLREFPPPRGHKRHPRKFHFQVEDGIVIHMDPELRKSIESESKQLRTQFEKMEELHMVKMQRQIEKEVQMEMEKLRAHLDSVAVELQKMDWGKFQPPEMPEIRIEIQMEDSARAQDKE